MPEPWMTGSHPEVPVVGRAIIHALELAAEDIAKWTVGLTDAEVHTKPLGLPSISFHLKHIARSIDRILTYAEGHQLTNEQLAALKTELDGNEPLEEIMTELKASFAKADERVRALANADLETPRAVGRKLLPTSIGGALIHVADHTQRHVGQVVATTKVLTELRAGGSI